MMLLPVTPQAIAHLVVTMRDESAAEAFASRADASRPELAADIARAAPGAIAMRMIGDAEGEPACLIGVFRAGPGRATMLFLANDRAPGLLMPAHRWWKRAFVPEVLSRFRRVEFTGSLPDTPSGRWLVWCGFACEGIARRYGKAGEDFAHWAWVNPAWPGNG